MNDIFRQSRFPIRRREASKHIIFFGEVKKLRESAPPLRGHFRLWLMGIADVAWLLVYIFPYYPFVKKNMSLTQKPQKSQFDLHIIHKLWIFWVIWRSV